MMNPNLKGILEWVLARLDEPSSYVGLGALLLSANIKVDPTILAHVSQAGIALAGLLGVVLSEGKKPA